ncbi:MAG: hypothetical protein ABJC09_10810 [Terriglobia bacterium]
MPTLSDSSPEASDTIGRLKHAIWHHDWDDAAALSAASLASELGRQEPATGPEELQRHLKELGEALSLARASRLELFSALSRLRAISGFSAPGGLMPGERQDFAVVTDS